MALASQTIQTTSSLQRTSKYAEDVLSGAVVAGPHVRNACRRFFDDLDKGSERGLYFDEEQADYAIRFFESQLKLSEGQFEGKPFSLHDSQAFIVGNLFGWVRENGNRRFKRAYIEQGKGNGKSPLAGGIGLFGLTADKEAGAQVYSAAAKKDQANILFRDAVQMVRKSPSLSKRIEISGGEGREYNLAFHPASSFFRPVSRDTGKTGSGPRPHFILADEIHEMPDRTILEILERGFKFRLSPLLVMITNSGSDRNSVCWEEHEHAINVAAGQREAVNDPAYVGDVIDDSTFAFVCSLDDDDDPLEDRTCWVKANPLLGVTITEEYLAEAVAQAKAIPGKLNGILRLHFCVWTDAETAWMTRAVVDPLLADFDPLEHKGKRAYLGLDLSQSQDLTALAAVVKTGERDGKPTFDAWIEAWTPGDTVAERELRDKLPYTVWIQEGHLQAPKGKSISFPHVGFAAMQYQRDYDVALLAYDRYAFNRFEEENDGLTIDFAEHPQGGKKKGKAINKKGDQLWMPESIRLLEELMLEGRIRLKRNPVLVSALLSAVNVSDPWGNSWIAKDRSLNKVDAAVALAMAVGAAVSLHERRSQLQFGSA